MPDYSVAQCEAQRLEIACLQQENERLRLDIERERALRDAYRCLPDEYHQGMLEYLVRVAFEAAELSHGRAAELLKCPVYEIREKGWIQGKRDEEIQRLRDECDWLRRKLAVYEGDLAKAGGDDE